ncbi:PREDICTED: rho GTPase-activating protein 20 [Propithecus coquereli]|uniref:rho GTPase-activating protein 20 n=1 Tax=Propithecus coquereli TaxID=379532 RepID=UPI00063F7AC6|nr:PREDICTED: rho GTPase-activating protein 20 [Propithecus coquereli]
MAAMSPQQETLGGQPGRSFSLTGVSRIAGDTGTKKPSGAPEVAWARLPLGGVSSEVVRAGGFCLERQPALMKVGGSAAAPAGSVRSPGRSATAPRENPSASIDTCAFLSSFVCSNRTLLIDGRVELKRGLQRQERHLFLFNDLFVVAKIKYNNNFKIKNKIKLTDMWIASCVDEVGEGNTNTMKSFVLGWPTLNFVATFSSPEQKDKWLSLLQRYINLEKEKDYPKSIPLKIFAKDIGNCVYSKTITVKNSDTANEVINMLFSMLGITGSERDYQLWVNSGKEDAPYPLIGHEYPYGIKMSHLRDTALLTPGSKDSTTPFNFQEPFLMEELPREMQCQFILKPSRLAAAQQLSDSGHKTFKRRRSIINWAFWRGSTTHLDNLPLSPPTSPPVAGQLFGVSLTNICENDNLPRPILVRLILNNDLKYLFFHLCKDFLRNIPGSIFSSDLYDRWVCVMDQGNDEEKINTIQRLLDQLPRANVVLLRYLFGVLHNIEQHSSSNQMNAFNLAVCIAPSVLWPPTSCSPELENEFTKKVTLLLQFLIENCCRIFGEEITSLFGEVSGRCDTRGNASDISRFQLSDSSYDSLENELNEDVDTPCSNMVKKLGQGSRSMDSILTFSDYDFDQPEVEDLLTLNDFDSDHSKEDHAQMEHPLESKPVNVRMCTNIPPQDPAEAPSGTRSHLSTAAADAAKIVRRNRRCSEPSIYYLDSKLSYLREFYQKKLRKSSCDAGLCQKDEDYLKQNQPLQEGVKTYFKQSLFSSTDTSKKNSTNPNIKKKILPSNEGNYMKLYHNSKPLAISVSSQDHFKNQLFDVDTSGYSPPHTADALKSSRKHRRCSEPNIDDQKGKLSLLWGICSKQHKSSWESVLSHEEDYLKRHKSLQIEGQKLISQSLVLGIEVGKSSATNQNTEKVLPPRLNLCPRTSYSSLSSPGTSPSGTPVSSQDSAFSQISEHSLFTPTETSSPIDCTFQAQRKQEKLSSDSSSSSLVSGMPGPSLGQASSYPAYTKKDTKEWHSQTHSVTLHPTTWLRNGVASLKNWSLKKKAKAARPEEKKTGSLKGPLELPPDASGVLEDNSLQEKQNDISLRAAEGLGAVQSAQWCGSPPCQDSGGHCSSRFSLVEGKLKLCMKSHEEVEHGGQGSSLPCERASASSWTVEAVASPDSGPAVVCDVRDKHLTKDI